MIEVDSLLSVDIVALHNYQNSFVFVAEAFGVCQYLTHLTFSCHGLQIDKSMFTALCNAVADKHLPKLSHLDFSECGSCLKGKVKYLFETIWPTLTSLNVSESVLSEQDVRIICAAVSGDLLQNCLPKLSSLAISPKYISNEGDSDNRMKFFTKPWEELGSRFQEPTHPNLKYIQGTPPLQMF